MVQSPSTAPVSDSPGDLPGGHSTQSLDVPGELGAHTEIGRPRAKLWSTANVAAVVVTRDEKAIGMGLPDFTASMNACTSEA